jgi:hypothetical protein
LYYNPTGKIMGGSLEMAEAAIPIISANAFRHVVFREPLFEHLLEECGLGSVEQVVTEKLLPEWVTMLFANGGNVRGGTTTPDNSASINYAIKQKFPNIDLLSGCLPTHIMGDGKLSVSSQTLCVQSNQFTIPLGYSSDVDAASLLQIITNSRHVPSGMDKSKESGQMLFSYTAMKKGVRVLMTLNFAPFTSELTRGAAYFSFFRWLQMGGEIGGRVGSGCGQLQLLKTSQTPDYFAHDEPEELAKLYEEYAHENREELRDHLTRGTLGWSKKLA